MKEAKLIHTRVFKCLDNPRNVAIFLKYYAKDEKPANHGTVIPLSFLENIQSDLLQLNCTKPYDKQIVFGPADNQYLFTYGITKCMTWKQLFGFMVKWVKKTIDPSASEFQAVCNESTGESLTLDYVLNNSEKCKMQLLKAA